MLRRGSNAVGSAAVLRLAGGARLIPRRGPRSVAASSPLARVASRARAACLCAPSRRRRACLPASMGNTGSVDERQRTPGGVRPAPPGSYPSQPYYPSVRASARGPAACGAWPCADGVVKHSTCIRNSLRLAPAARRQPTAPSTAATRAWRLAATRRTRRRVPRSSSAASGKTPRVCLGLVPRARAAPLTRPPAARAAAAAGARAGADAAHKYDSQQRQPEEANPESRASARGADASPVAPMPRRR